MNRLHKVMIKNWYKVPAIFIKLYKYASNPQKYPVEQRYEALQYIVDQTKKTGNLSITVFGRENIPKENGFIFYPNHQGIFDGFAMIEAYGSPFSPVIKKELMDVPVVKQIFICMDAMPMDREDIRQSLTVIQEVSERVKQKRNCLIFPEGTRSCEGNRLLGFKAGSFKAAQLAKCPIVPVAIINSYQVFDKDNGEHIAVQVHILKPIDYLEYGKLKSGQIAELVKGRIEEVLEREIIP